MRVKPDVSWDDTNSLPSDLSQNIYFKILNIFETPTIHVQQKNDDTTAIATATIISVVK